MRLLLGSGGLGTPERTAAWNQALDHFLGSIDTILFVPYAGNDPDFYVDRLVELNLVASRKLVGIHTAADPVKAIAQADTVFVGGGNTWRLQTTMLEKGLLGPLRERAQGGMPYIGVSAGSNLACPTIQTTNDMPIVIPETVQALGLVPFQINAHYFEGRFYVKEAGEHVMHRGETRDDRINEFHQMNETPVLGLWEGGLLRVDERGAAIGGTAGGRLFRKGKIPQDLPVGADVTDLMTPA